MANLNLSDFLKTLREKFAASGYGKDVMGDFDRSVAESVVSLVDGNPPEPKKRSYVRKPKPPASE